MPSNLKTARFFTLHRKEGTFTNCSPFVIHKAIITNVGEIRSVKNLRSGDLLVEVRDIKRSENLIKCTLFGDMVVSVSAHNTLNSSRGIISERDVFNCSEEEILTGLEC